MKQEIWVYSAKQSPRLNYVLNFISTIWDIAFQVTSDIDEFTQIETAKINYSHQDLGGIQIQPQKLLVLLIIISLLQVSTALVFPQVPET